MAVGLTTTGVLDDSLPLVIASARIVREYEGCMPNLVDKHTLGEGEGNTWNEVKYEKLTAQAITESTVLDNPQLISDSLLSAEPSVVGIETLITDRVAKRITKNGFAKIGALGQNAIQRKKDEDGLAMLDGFSTSLCGAGGTLTSGHIGAGMARIQGNSTEKGNPPFYCVLHPYQLHDVEDELLAGVGTYNVTAETARVFAEGYQGKIAGASVFVNGNITVDSSDDAKGGVFAKEALVMVQGRSPWVKTVRAENIGGGATRVYHYDEYVYAERSDHWGAEIYSDATAPTS